MKLYKHVKEPGLFEVTQKFEVTAQGGGFVKVFDAETFHKEFEEIKNEPVLKKGKVTADFLPSNMTVECYSYGLSWNGWGLPLFTRAAVEAMVAAVNGPTQEPTVELSMVGDIVTSPNENFDKSVPESEDNPLVDKFGPELYIVDGQQIELWSIGDGWTWDAVKFDDPFADETQSNLAGELIIGDDAVLTLEQFRSLRKFEGKDEAWCKSYGIEAPCPFNVVEYGNTNCIIEVLVENEFQLVIGAQVYQDTLHTLEEILYNEYYLPEIAGVPRPE